MRRTGGRFIWLCVSVVTMCLFLWMRHATVPVALLAVGAQIAFTGTILRHLQQHPGTVPSEIKLFQLAVVFPWWFCSFVAIVLSPLSR